MLEINKKKEMQGITKPSITRLSRRSGVKSLSDDCYDEVRDLMNDKLKEIVNAVMIVNSEHNTKTIMVNDIYHALHLLGYNVTQSSELSTNSCIKK